MNTVGETEVHHSALYYSILTNYNTVYWESFTEENIHEFRGFWSDRKCFLATIFYLVIILTKNVHC